MIELRRGIDQHDLPESERARLSDFLKVLANSASYGIFAEMNREESKSAVEVDRYGLDRQRVEVAAPEQPGRWCFPPLAALTAGAARLMLVLLERAVSYLGGSYVFCDTDSMGIVASESGGTAALDGLPGADGLRALSWSEVHAIIERFERLKPYDPEQVSATLLKIEDDNYDEPGSQGRQLRQLYCYAISAKRYCLYNLNGRREVEIRKLSESGLGHLLDPLDPEREAEALDPDDRALPETPPVGREWIRQFWADTLAEAYGGRAPRRQWLARPAVSQLAVSTPHLLADFEETNQRRAYAEQVKPFNFMLIARDASIGADRKVLVAPYERDSRRWLRQPWRNRADGRPYPITVRIPAGGSEVVRVVTYESQLAQHRVHMEAKSLAADGGPCRPQTSGRLQRQPVVATGIEHIGKEANRIDEVAAGLVQQPDAYTVFEDAWPLARQVLERVSIEQARQLTERGRSATMELRAGRSRSSRRHRAEMVAAIAQWCRDALPEVVRDRAPLSDFEALDAWLAIRA